MRMRHPDGKPDGPEGPSCEGTPMPEPPPYVEPEVPHVPPVRPTVPPPRLTPEEKLVIELEENQCGLS